ncbi:MAG: protein kinase [Pirellulales bacterium]|nr:protein kinase [Pirellulales bacterium]
MAITSPEDLLRLLRKSGLLSPEQLAHAQDTVLLTGNAEEFAQILIDEGMLTKWQADQLLAGSTKFHVGNYVLLAMLGRGGMGSVFLARHTTMDRQVALKIVSRRVGKDPASRERFLSEARAAASLDHPNIVRAYDVDSDNERLFIVMEYVAGRDLRELVELDGPLDFELLADCIRQAAEGLAHAHRRNMVHCDIKPSNLLLSEKGVVKILDLGMARLLNQTAEDSSVDRSDRVLGTVDYMAPEQAMEGPDFNHRADIYSLGCTMYYLLTGHPPFDEGTLAQRIVQHQTKPPPDILAEHPDTPPDLVRICLKMMAKDPADRFQSADDVAKLLTDWHPPKPPPTSSATAEPGSKPPSTGVAIDEEDFKNVVLQKAAPVKPQGIMADERRLIFWMATVAIVLGVLLAIVAVFLLAGRDEPDNEQLSRAQVTQPDNTKRSEPATTPAPSEPNPIESPADQPTKPPVPPPAAPENPKTADSTALPVSPNLEPQPQPKPQPTLKPKSEPRPTPTPKPSTGSSGLQTGASLVTSSNANSPTSISLDSSQSGGRDRRSPKPSPRAAKSNPLRHLPRSVALPPAAHVDEPLVLGTLRLSAADRPALALLGGETATDTGSRFVLEPETDKSTWTVRLVGNNAAPMNVARFSIQNQTLAFGWLDVPETTPSAALRHCLLEIRAGKHRHLIQLVAPRAEAPLTLLIDRGSAERRIPVKDLPREAITRAVITRIEGLPDKGRLKKAAALESDKQEEIVLYDRRDCKFALRAAYQSRGAAHHLDVAACFQLPGQNQLTEFSSRKIRGLYIRRARSKNREAGLLYAQANARGLSPTDENSLKEKLDKVQAELQCLNALLDWYEKSNGVLQVHFQEQLVIDKYHVVLLDTRLFEDTSSPP